MENKKTFKLLLWGAVILLLGFFLFIKMDFQKSIPQAYISEKIWVYIEIQTEMVRDTTDYFYYGQVNESLINDIDIDKNSEGLFILSNIRYWNDEDLLQVYENDERADYKVFPVHSIKCIQQYKKDPIFIFEIEELHDSAKETRGVY